MADQLTQVVIERGFSQYATDLFEVEVRNSKTNSATICGNYTGKSNKYYNEVVECGGSNNLLILLRITA